MGRIEKQLRSAAAEPVRLRVNAPKGLKAASIDLAGGRFGAGIIKGYSVITRGEALGHDLWIDKDFLDEVVAAGNAREGGIKSRFTHPGLSGDGLGKSIGKSRDFRTRYGQVVADLHLTKSSHDTPDGDLGGHILNLAQETPEDFGASIVFRTDDVAMKKFSDENTDKKTSIFTSPDPHNKGNLPHARLASLSASDMVDEPAANPAGMFSAAPGSELATAADALLDYVLGRSDVKPAALGEIHPERIKTFLSGYLERRGLRLSSAPGEVEIEAAPVAPEPIDDNKFERQPDALRLRIRQRKGGSNNVQAP